MRLRCWSCGRKMRYQVIPHFSVDKTYRKSQLFVCKCGKFRCNEHYYNVVQRFNPRAVAASLADIARVALGHLEQGEQANASLRV